MHRSSRLALGSVVAATALLAGCASSDDGDSGDDGNSGATAADSPLPGFVTDLWDLRDDLYEAGGLEDDVEEFEDFDDLDEPGDIGDIEDELEDLEDEYEPEDVDGDLMDADQLHGLWTGDDGSIFGVVNADESEVVFPTTHYLPPDGNVETDECLGVLLGSAAAGWNTSFHCDEDSEEGDFVRIEETGSGVEISWLDDDFDVTDTVGYTYLSDWD